MDHFLFAKNPLKKTPSTGLQGYIIDTVKGIWLKVEVFNATGKPDIHKLTIIAGTGNKTQDALGANRAARWYDSILIARKVKEAQIEVVLLNYAEYTDSISPSNRDRLGIPHDAVLDRPNDMVTEDRTLRELQCTEDFASQFDNPEELVAASIAALNIINQNLPLNDPRANQ